jgi:type I restriction enzyme R subunit
MRKLLAEKVRVRIRGNPLRFSSFKEKLEKTIRAYHNRALTSAQVMEELIKIAREIKESETEREKLGLTEEELAFYDALARGKEYILSNEQLKRLAKKLVDTIRKNLSIDWTKHESVKAKVRAAVKRTLRTYGISPFKHPSAIELIMEQAQALYKDWPSVAISLPVEPTFELDYFPPRF